MAKLAHTRFDRLGGCGIGSAKQVECPGKTEQTVITLGMVVDRSSGATVGLMKAQLGE